MSSSSLSSVSKPDSGSPLVSFSSSTASLSPVSRSASEGVAVCIVFSMVCPFSAYTAQGGTAVIARAAHMMYASPLTNLFLILPPA